MAYMNIKTLKLVGSKLLANFWHKPKSNNPPLHFPQLANFQSKTIYFPPFWGSPLRLPFSAFKPPHSWFSQTVWVERWRWMKKWCHFGRGKSPEGPSKPAGLVLNNESLLDQKGKMFRIPHALSLHFPLSIYLCLFTEFSTHRHVLNCKGKDTQIKINKGCHCRSVSMTLSSWYNHSAFVFVVQNSYHRFDAPWPLFPQWFIPFTIYLILK